VERELGVGSEGGAACSLTGFQSRTASSDSCATMSSLVERLRVRSERRPRYALDESDDDLPLRAVAGKGKDRQNDAPAERIEREDAVWLIGGSLLCACC